MSLSAAGFAAWDERIAEQERELYKDADKDTRYNHSDKGRARSRRYNQKRYYRMLAEGRCPHCYWPLVAEGGVHVGEAGTGTRCIHCVSQQAFYDMGRMRPF